MIKDPPLPFKEGDLVETKSFLKGYRGAWFRCEIAEITSGRNRSGHILHYIDFPDQKKTWVASYQVPPNPAGSSKKKRARVSGQKKEVDAERQLVLRPPYPPIYRKDELISTSARSNTRVVIEGHWCVGDLVDMLRDGVYWCGKVIQVFDQEETMVELLPPPFGEGDLYKASMAELRPTLNWSQESGWTVPTPEGVADFHQRVQILYPEKKSVDSDLPTSEEHVHCETVIEVVAGTPETTEKLENAGVLLISNNIDSDLPASEEHVHCETITKVVADTPETTEKLVNAGVQLMSDYVDRDIPASEEHVHCETVTKVVADTPGTTEKLENVGVPLMSGKVDSDLPASEEHVRRDKVRKVMADTPEITEKLENEPETTEKLENAPVTTEKLENAEVLLVSENVDSDLPASEEHVRRDKGRKVMTDTPETTEKLENEGVPLKSENVDSDLPASEVHVRCGKVRKVMTDTPETTEKLENAGVLLMSENVDSDLPASEEHVRCGKVRKVMADTPETTEKLENAGVPLMSENVDSDLPTSEEHVRCETVRKVMADTPETSEKLENAEVPLMSDAVDTVEAAIIDLEELASKLTWLKQILKHGYPLPDGLSSSWDFVERHSS